jgi:hypothetical protein
MFMSINATGDYIALPSLDQGGLLERTSPNALSYTPSTTSRRIGEIGFASIDHNATATVLGNEHEQFES